MSQDRAKEQVKTVWNGNSPVEGILGAVRAKIAAPVDSAQVGEGQERRHGPQRRSGSGASHAPSGLALRQIRQSFLVGELDPSQPLLQLLARLNTVLWQNLPNKFPFQGYNVLGINRTMPFILFLRSKNWKFDTSKFH